MDLFEHREDLHALALAAEWDLAVIDEAHHLHWSEQEAGEDYQLVEALAAKTAGLLLLTATPEQIGQASHFARLRLLDPSRFHDLAIFQKEEQDYKQLSEWVDLIADDIIPPGLPADVDTSGSNDATIAQLLDRHGTGRVLFRNTRAAIKGFPKRVLHRHPLPAPEERVKWLESTLKQLRPAKVLVICANAKTALDLEHYLHMRAGIRSAAFYEGLSIIERDRAAAYFADEVNGAQSLVCSEIGSEGRNFQFAHHLVLFDLPLNPDLLEQRIGRLDRIGQSRDVEIHVPYLEDTAQQILLEWYDRGLNLFLDSCSAGYTIYEKFHERLWQQLAQPSEEFESLVADTAVFTEQTRLELREGRDRLLERNSCKPEIAQGLIEEISADEDSADLQDYLESLCEAYGVDFEFHSDATLILRPSDHMLTGHFPRLPEEGTTVTFDREKALAREDMEFMTWEHPMIVEAMDMVHSTELGNAALGTIKLKGIPPGTMLLESLFTINCVAPKSLQIERFLPISPLRLLVDARGKDLSTLLPHARLNTLVERVGKSTALAIIKNVRSEVESKMTMATAMAEAQLTALLAEAEARMSKVLGAELQRLKALQAVNPSIRPEEISHLEFIIEECGIHIRHASLQLQALRLIITV
ncbi:UNVERIFIED_CONTAM: hypothetical protein GTU68_034845 [Idotea baltica]|nr:hypothetical protein [Idotea baltica]